MQIMVSCCTGLSGRTGIFLTVPDEADQAHPYQEKENDDCGEQSLRVEAAIGGEIGLHGEKSARN